MSQTAPVDTGRLMPSPDLDESWRRLGWIVPAAVLLWAGLLTAFAFLLERTAPPPPELAPAEMRIVELPPTAGLQGGPAAPAPAKPKVQPAKPHPHVKVHRAAIPRTETHHLTKPQPVPRLPASANGTAKSSAQTPTESGASSKSGAQAPNAGVSGGTGMGGGAGVGSDSGGARALFAPKPVIPDDLREQAFHTVAVAHFRVSYDGEVQVTLTRPTESPRLNELLLEALKQWRFFPAMRNGVAIDSQFDVRIPISVQ